MKKEVEKVLPEEGGTDCKTDAECSDGYHCVNGRCVKKTTTLPPGNPPPIPPLAD